MTETNFCERNFKLVFVLLVALTAATGVWAFFAARKAKGAQAADSGLHFGNGSAGKAAWTETARPLTDAITRSTPHGGLYRLVATPQPGRGTWQSGFQSAFNVVASRISPVTVNINAIRENVAPAGLRGGEGIRFMPPFDGGAKPGRPAPALESVGAGIIVDSRGYILTNYHVVSQAKDMLVSVFGNIRRDFPATVAAADPGNDLALLKLTGAPPLPEAKLGDSDLVRVGDWVLAFGSPFGLDQTVTQGIISSKRKSLVVEGIAQGDMLQTDAPINRGSSGGPLVNMNAEVIGINTAIYGPGGVFSGAGFAIPVNRAKVFMASVKEVFRM